MSTKRVFATQSIPGPDDIVRAELGNGIVVLARANFSSPSVTIGGWLNVGSLLDSDKRLGLANFTALGLMRGTRDRDFHAIYNALESVGASLGFGGGTHATAFNGRAMVDDLDLLLSLLADVLYRPAFPRKQIKKLRAQILTGLALRAQSTEDQAAMAFDSAVYVDHPYARPDQGFIHTVRKMRSSHMRGFHANHYGPEGTIIVIVGGIEPQQAVAKIKAVLGDWRNPQQQLPPPLPEWQPLTEMKRVEVKVPSKSQSDLVVGTTGPTRRSPDFLAAAIGNNILGQFGLMGRIGQSLREQAGIAYYAKSNISSSMGPGPWSVQAGVDPKDVDRAVELILKEIKNFVSELVAKEELADSKANFIGSLPLSLESNAGVASALMHLEKHSLGLDYYQRFPELINAITREQVLEVAQRYLDPQRLAIAIAGP